MTSSPWFCAVRSLVALMAIPLVVHGGEASAVRSSAGALRVSANISTFELAPVLLAASTLHDAPVAVTNGGVPDLFKPGGAQLATNAETQALRVSVDHPDLRIILTVSEGWYRIVGRRSAGIATLADLKGKRIATVPNTSSAYYLHRMLRTAGLTDADVTVVPVLPLSRLAEALERREVDAVTIWEPEIENAAARIGADAIEFQDRRVYRELFNLHATAGELADPAQRARIVAFVRSVLRATKAIHTDPRPAWALVAAASKYDEALIARTWHHEGYPGGLARDLLEVLVDEEGFVAREKQRAPRPRAELARLIDGSVLEEAIAADPSLRITAPSPDAVLEQARRLRPASLAQGEAAGREAGVGQGRPAYSPNPPSR